MCLFHFYVAIRPLWPQSWLLNLSEWVRVLLLLLVHSARPVDECGEVAVQRLWRGDDRLGHNDEGGVAPRPWYMTVINKNDAKKAAENIRLVKGWVALSLVLLVLPSNTDECAAWSQQDVQYVQYVDNYTVIFVCIILTLHMIMMMTLIICAWFNVIISDITIWAKKDIRFE